MAADLTDRLLFLLCLLDTLGTRHARLIQPDKNTVRTLGPLALHCLSFLDFREHDLYLGPILWGRPLFTLCLHASVCCRNCEVITLPRSLWFSGTQWLLILTSLFHSRAQLVIIGAPVYCYRWQDPVLSLWMLKN